MSTTEQPATGRQADRDNESDRHCADPSRLTSANSPKVAARQGCREGRISCAEIGANDRLIPPYVRDVGDRPASVRPHPGRGGRAVTLPDAPARQADGFTDPPPRDAVTSANAAGTPGLRTYLAHSESRHRPCESGTSEGCSSPWLPAWPGGVHRAKYESFELYRRNLYEPEIITFDELLARAEWHVEVLDESS